MINRRRFYIICGNQKIDLNNPRGIFFSAPSGLGAAWMRSYNHLGGGFFDVGEEVVEQGNIVGDIIFTRDPYRHYQTLLNAMTAHAENLVLVYKPRQTEYRTRVDFEFLQKGEVKNGVLICPVSWRMKTPWYKDKSLTFRISQPEKVSNPKTYPYTYDYRYPVRDDAAKTLYTNDGHMDAALDITVPGALSSPIFKLTTKDGRLIGTCNLNGLMVRAGNTLRLSSLYGQQYGVWVDGVDVANYVSLTDNNFFRLPVGVPCILDISDLSNNTITASVRVYSYYRSV